MAYDEQLADRIRQAVGPRDDVTEKKMFGGIAFLLDGKMFVGVVKDALMVRVGPAGYADANPLPAPFVSLVAGRLFFFAGVSFRPGHTS